VLLASAPATEAEAKPMFKVGGASAAQANRGKRSRGQSIMLGGTLMFFENASSQGGQELPGGRTIYSTFNLQYNWPEFFTGVGAVYELDLIGDFRRTTASGLKLEFSFGGYYFEVGRANVSETFTGRAVGERTGTRQFYAGGIRVPFLYESVYFDGGIRKRQTTFTTQDDETLTSPLQESVLMPFIGAGVSF